MDLNAGIPEKNVVVSVLLPIVLGPIGMFYSTIPGALVMLSVFLLSAVGWYAHAVGLIADLFQGKASAVFSPWGLWGYGVVLESYFFLLYCICILWSLLAARSFNRELLAGGGEWEGGDENWKPIRSRAPSVQAQDVASSMQLECPHCGEPVPVTDVGRFCKECGGKMPVVRKMDAPQRQAEANPRLTCKACRIPFDAAAGYCRACGWTPEK